ncbi:MAG: aminotransferase class I/II-fold pyridoxal phosphate-dependent enzyme [Bacteroidota bacterium]
MKNFKKLIVNGSMSLRQALQRLNDTGQRLLLLVDNEGRLIRTITDGDIRRLLLEGLSLEDCLSKLPPLPPKTITQPNNSVAALALMNDFDIDHLPIVDGEGRPVSLLLRRDLDSQILLSTPHLGGHEREFVEEAFRTNWIAPLGPNVNAFERELAEYVGIKHAAAVSSGTAAIHLALRLLGVGAGDIVFCSTFTFVASVNPILYVGASPVFIDSEPETWNMSHQALSRAFADAAAKNALPKAVIVVNLYGQSANMDPIMEICDSYNVPVVEDAAESLGATYKGRASGTIGRLGIYSFNGNKIITTSGGGMLVSNDSALIERARFLSTQARDPALHYQHSEMGYNYRMSNILAGIGRGQLKVLESRVEARRVVFQRYQEGLAHVSALRWMPEPSYGRCTHWLTACTIDSAKSRLMPTDIISALALEKIEARHVWKPMHLQPLFANCPYYTHDDMGSVSDRLFAQGLCLPSGSNMSVDQQNRIIAVIVSLFS